MFFSKEDIEAWKAATRGVRKFLHISDPEPQEQVEEAPSAKPLKNIEEALFHVKHSKLASPAYLSDLIEGSVGRMEKNSFSRLKKGNIRPHIVEDLHGMGLQQAKEYFYQLIKHAHACQMRCILLITGKGFEAPGKIRSAVPEWVNDPDLKPRILAFTHAAPKDGGKGAFYIYLAKN